MTKFNYKYPKIYKMKYYLNNNKNRFYQILNNKCQLILNSNLFNSKCCFNNKLLQINRYKTIKHNNNKK